MLVIITFFSFIPLVTADDCIAVSKIGHCPPKLIHSDGKPCTSNLDCSGNRLCCYGGESQPQCSDPLETKGYDCPAPDKIQTANQSCLLDSECPGDEKCCPTTPCAYTCVPPIKNTPPVIEFRQSTCYLPPDARCPFRLVYDNKISCTSHKDCINGSNARMCCPDESGGNTCSEPYTTRDGLCPFLSDMIIENAPRCYLDTNCPANKKCCFTGLQCLYACVDPVSTGGGTPSCFSIPKLGACPAILINEGRTACTDDSQCPGNRLCCRRSFGTERRCSDPFSPNSGKCPTPGNLDLTQPQCYTDNDCPSGSKCCPLNNCSYYCAKVGNDGPSGVPDCGPSEKFGTCPTTPINPSYSCGMSTECPGHQLCCSGVCSDAANNKRGRCPPPSQVSKGYNTCYADGNCSGATNRKCCPDVNCNYYCTYTNI